jgi:hypothetical protein
VFGTPESKAWAAVWIGFIIFCTLLVSIPLLIRSHVVNATTAQKTMLEDPIDGVVNVKKPGESDFIRVTERNPEIPEGAAIATDENFRAFLRLFDDSTLTLYDNTEIVLERVRAARYAASRKPNDIQFRVNRGRVGVAVASPIKGTSHLGVYSPHAYVMLKEGSYSVVVDEEQTHIAIRTIRPGEATIITEDEKKWFNRGLCRVVDDLPIEGPLPPEQNLIVNSDFSSPLGRGWEEQPPQRQEETDPLGMAQIVVRDGKTLLSFARDGASTWGESSIIQRIDKDVRDFSSLRMSFEVLVNAQSLAGGGYKSTEFPVMVELQYKDVNDDSRFKYWGFFYMDPGTGPEWVKLVNGTKVVQGEWYFFESENLMQTLGEIRPVHIENVRVYASGWDWNSAITNISLLVQE